jgi:[CysO sulfur-carrier protein]-S-L-cysteine hydrolase
VASGIGNLAFVLSRAAREEIVAHARREAPRECCGLLVGRGGAIEEAVRARNLADAPTRYFMDPRDHFDALRHARSRGVDVLGFYHSHPHSAAWPSETDRAEAHYADHVYLIVSLADDEPDVRLFRLVDGNFLELMFVTVG